MIGWISLGGECAVFFLPREINILFLRSFAGVRVLRKTVGGGAKLRTTLRNNIFISPNRFGVWHILLSIVLSNCWE